MTIYVLLVHSINFVQTNKLKKLFRWNIRDWPRIVLYRIFYPCWLIPEIMCNLNVYEILRLICTQIFFYFIV